MTPGGTKQTGNLRTEVSELEVAMVGAGTMGHALAMTFLAGGLRVTINDSDISTLTAAEPRIREGLRSWRGDEGVEGAMGRLVLEPNLPSAVATADIVIEAVIEDLESKKRMFRDLESYAREDTVLCTNTSALPIAEITSNVERGNRVLGTHWFNPPHLVPAVEVIRAPQTSDAVLTFVISVLSAIGKIPVQVPDVPGFIANRLQMALVREAVTCVEEGLVSAADIDLIFSNSIGFRLGAVGPLSIADFAGLDVYLSVFETLAREVSSRFEPPRLLQDCVASGNLGIKSGAGFLPHSDPQQEVELRDSRLLALAKLHTSSEWMGATVSAPLAETAS